MEAQTLAEHRVFRVMTKASGRLQYYWWYQRGWFIDLSPQAGSATKAVIQTVAAVVVKGTDFHPTSLPLVTKSVGLALCKILG